MVYIYIYCIEYLHMTHMFHELLHVKSYDLLANIYVKETRGHANILILCGPYLYTCGILYN